MSPTALFSETNWISAERSYHQRLDFFYKDPRLTVSSKAMVVQNQGKVGYYAIPLDVFPTHGPYRLSFHVQTQPGLIAGNTPYTAGHAFCVAQTTSNRIAAI